MSSPAPSPPPATCPARVLARSWREHHPDGRFFCVITDDPLGTVGPDEPFEVVPVTAIGLTARDFALMTIYYDVTELSTAIKPWVLSAVREARRDRCSYLDPDICVYDSLVEMAELASELGIVLTPHVLTPMPRDGRLPEERHVLQSGMFNLGFIGVGSTTEVDTFLGYWKERLRVRRRRRPGADAVHRPAVDRLRARHVLVCDLARPGLQRRLLERPRAGAGRRGGRSWPDDGRCGSSTSRGSTRIDRTCCSPARR